MRVTHSYPESAGPGLIPVASYARTSEDFRRRDAHGVNNQHRINERSARAYGCVIVAAYTDNGRGASKPGSERLGFDQLLADLRKGSVHDGRPLHGVVSVADDRLYRTTEDFARFFEALTCRPGRVQVDQNGIRNPYTKEGLLQAVHSLEAANTETETRGRRLRDWHWSRAVDGTPHSGPRPFGWQDDRLTLHTVEADLVRRAIEDRINGKAVRAVAREWRELGITGTRGGLPKSQTVTQIITAPRVCGYRANRGTLLLHPDSGQPVVGQWAPIVTPDQWRAVCTTFEAGSLYAHRGSGAPRLTKEKARPLYLASGFLRCGAVLASGEPCNQKLGGGRGSSRKSPYRYACTHCGRCAISGPLVDHAIETLLFPVGGEGRVRLPEPLRRRWSSGEMGFEERRKVIASVFRCLVVQPGVKGRHAWDYLRITPVWKWADRVAVPVHAV
ncbi:recombinase family protein [Streptomyces sp. NPDC054887]